MTSAVPRLRVLASILALACALRLVFAIGISGNDDMSLAAAAIKLLDHGWHVPVGHYEARLGLVLPLAGAFALAGVNEAALLLIPLAMSLLGVFLAYRIGAALFDNTVGLLAACALAIYPMDVEYAGLYFPDLIQGSLMALAFLLLLGRPGCMAAAASGLVLGYAYYVKEDAVFMGAVLLLGAVLGHIAWSRLVLAGLVALAFVGLEFGAYGVLTGHPFLHAELVRRANDEVLAANRDYRDIWTYPKAMFLVPHETGLTFYVAATGVILAFGRKSRALAIIIGWCLVFFAWLSFGFDPFSLEFRLKPQIPRYLQDFSIPLCVLVGWTCLQLWRRLPHWICYGAGASAFGLAFLCAAANALNYQAPRATLQAVDAAMPQGWFPLYTDVQSISIADFLLHDSVHRADVHAAQTHDFLAGQTHFASIEASPAFLLVNEAFAARLRQRNLVRPIDPEGLGMRATPLASIVATAPPLGGALLSALSLIAQAAPAPLAAKLRSLVTDTRDSGIVRIYRLEK